jgi:hypothetical protein
VGTSLVGQVALHLVFGNETFFYSLHWVPILVVLVAHATLVERWRPAILSIVACFGVVAGANNLIQFSRAVRFLQAQESVVQALESAEHRQSRTADPWPRTAIVLETPWDRDDYDQAAYEPGGTLWPSMDTFNIGFWVMGPDGRMVATSHSLSSEEVHAAVVDMPGQGPRLDVTTPYYQLRWQSERRRRWRLDLTVAPPADRRLFLAIRGVGWRYSRIRSIVRSDSGLLINGRWRVEMTGSIGQVAIGEEGAAGWETPDATARSTFSEMGWGFARIGPLAPGTMTLAVFDEREAASVDTVLGPLDATARVPGAELLPR